MSHSMQSLDVVRQVGQYFSLMSAQSSNNKQTLDSSSKLTYSHPCVFWQNWWQSCWFDWDIEPKKRLFTHWPGLSQVLAKENTNNCAKIKNLKDIVKVNWDNLWMFEFCQISSAFIYYLLSVFLTKICCYVWEIFTFHWRKSYIKNFNHFIGIYIQGVPYRSYA